MKRSKILPELPLETDPSVDLNELSDYIIQGVSDLFKNDHGKNLVDYEANSLNLLDLNELKNIIYQTLLCDKSHQNSNILWIEFFNGYIDHVTISKISQFPQIYSYLVETINSFFKIINLDVIYVNEGTKESFNKMLNNFILLSVLNSSQDLLLMNLRTITISLKHKSPKVLSYAQIVTIEQLFGAQRFSDIAELYDVNKIEQFTEIDPTSLQKSKIFSFYFDLIRSMINIGRYQDSYQLFQILFKLPITIENKTLMENLMTVYSINLILIGNTQKRRDTNIMKFGASLEARYLTIFQSFQTLDFTKFLRLVYSPYHKAVSTNTKFIGLDPSIFIVLMSTLRLAKLKGIIAAFSRVRLSDITEFDPIVTHADVIHELDLEFPDTETFLSQNGYLISGNGEIHTPSEAKADCNHQLLTNLQLVNCSQNLDGLLIKAETMVKHNELQALKIEQQQHQQQQHSVLQQSIQEQKLRHQLLMQQHQQDQRL